MSAGHTLNGLDAVLAILLLLRERREDGDVVVRRAGKRYGGFNSLEHARFFVSRMGWGAEASVAVEPSEVPRA